MGRIRTDVLQIPWMVQRALRMQSIAKRCIVTAPVFRRLAAQVLHHLVRGHLKRTTLLPSKAGTLMHASSSTDNNLIDFRRCCLPLGPDEQSDLTFQ